MTRYLKGIVSLLLACAMSFYAYADEPAGNKPSPFIGAQVGTADRAAMIEAYKAERWEDVVRTGEVLTALPNMDGSVWAMLGVGYFSLGIYDKALHAFQQEALASGSNDQNLRNIAFSSIRLGVANGCELGHQALERIPDDAMLHNETGKLCLKQKQDALGIPHLQKAIELDPQKAIYITDLTQHYFRKKDNASAEVWTAKGIRNGHTISPLYINVTLACFRQEKHEDAIRWADEGFEKTHDPLLLYHKANALIALGKIGEAKAALEQSLEKGLMFSRYTLARVKMYDGCSDERYGSCGTAAPDACCDAEREALRLFGEAESDQVENENYEQYAAYYGLALILSGKFEQAEPLIRAVANEKKNFNQALFSAALAVAAWQSEPRDDAMARRYYDEAVQTDARFGRLEDMAIGLLVPPRAIQTLRAIADSQKVNMAAAKKSSACGCALRKPSAPTLPVLLAFFLAAWVALRVRRKV